jgi:hypothetical protein
MNCNVLNFYRDLKSNKSGEARFSTVEIKCDESGISRVDLLLGWKVRTSVGWDKFEGLLRLTWQPDIVPSHRPNCNYELP